VPQVGQSKATRREFSKLHSLSCLGTNISFYFCTTVTKRPSPNTAGWQPLTHIFPLWTSVMTEHFKHLTL